MRTSADYRRAWLDLHEAADRFRVLPSHRVFTPETLDALTSRLQRTVEQLKQLYNSHIPSDT
jgi:hypothetical protein